MTPNLILDTDSYKLPMFDMLPKDVTNVFSYAESRGGRYPATVFFGLQPFLHRLVENPITLAHVNEAEEFAARHGEPFNRRGWMRVMAKHGGLLPLEIKAVPEGTLVPTGNVLCTVENTDPALPWLTTYMETALLRAVWYATTVATRIFGMKRGLREEFEYSADDLSDLPFALLDFSSRGCTSLGANEIGGAAYLAHFLGSDSVPAVRFTNAYYDSPMSGFSVPATEHSIMCAWGEDRESEAFEHLIRTFGGPGKIISIVSDTYNIFRAAHRLARFKELIQTSGTTLVVRPDSGDMTKVLQGVIPTLANAFGTTKNRLHFDVLNGVKVLWGDGIDEDSYRLPFQVAAKMNVSAQSIMVGSGGGLMQKDIDRDTCKFAFKASAVKDASGWRGISKRPITDPGKRSKEGRLALTRDSSGLGFSTVQEGVCDASFPNLLRPVYRNGALLNRQSIDGIRARIDAQL